MRELLNKFIVLLIAVTLPLSGFFAPNIARAEQGDVGLVYSHFRFSQVPLITGQQVRMYAAIKNNGLVDMSGEVSFSLPGGMIKQPIPFTSVANGAFEEIWTDFTVPEDPFNIYIQVWVNEDSDPSNNTYFSPRYTPLADRDRDAVPDEQDNCSGRANPYQEDENEDGVGDACEEIVSTPEPGLEPPVAESVPTQETLSPTVEPVQFTQDQGDDTSVNNANDVIGGEVNSRTLSLTEPAPVVAGEDTAGFGPKGNVIISPNARFSYERLAWNVYVFSALQPHAGAVYTWETSDGRTHVGSEATFHFSNPGAYTVKLITSKIDGTFLSEEVTVHTSFFHLQNPWLMSLIIGLLVLCGLILWQGSRRQSEERRENSA